MPPINILVVFIFYTNYTPFLQMKSEADAVYIFSIVGKLRY